uniref:Probable conjugal transfer (TrbJ) n=1 Tax=Leptospirillum ferrodiazotrophum TaxID=412449 RepID=C6HTX2_9BACT|nr:MAG: probable conjugal transfer (TrbJ) [Leptospirillum ferrodiazotrophum]
MKNPLKKALFLFGVVLCLLGRISTPAFASGALGTGSVVFDPANFTNTLATDLNTAMQVENEISQLYYLYKDLKSMPPSAWATSCGLLSNISMIASQLPALSATAQQVSANFSSTNPGYTPSQNYSAQQGALTSNFNTQLNNDLAQVNTATSGMATGACQLQALSGMNTKGFSGKLQAIQTGTSVAILEVGTLQQMQSLQLQQAQEQRAYMAQRVQSRASVEAAGNCFSQSGSYGVGHVDGTVSAPPSGCGPNGGGCQQTTDAFGNTVYRPTKPDPTCTTPPSPSVSPSFPAYSGPPASSGTLLGSVPGGGGGSSPASGAGGSGSPGSSSASGPPASSGTLLGSLPGGGGGGGSASGSGAFGASAGTAGSGGGGGTGSSGSGSSSSSSSGGSTGSGQSVTQAVAARNQALQSAATQYQQTKSQAWQQYQQSVASDPQNKAKYAAQYDNTMSQAGSQYDAAKAQAEQQAGAYSGGAP